MQFPFQLDPITFATTITKLAMMDHAALALLSDNTVWAWGDNTNQRIGVSGNAALWPPVQVTFGAGEVPVDIAAGKDHWCVALRSGGLKCVGANSQGQLGIGSTTAQLNPTTAPLALTSGVAGVEAGRYTTCALMDGGCMRCFGEGRE